MNFQKIQEVIETYNNSLLDSEQSNKVDVSTLKNTLLKTNNNWKLLLEECNVPPGLSKKLEPLLKSKETQEEFLFRNYNPYNLHTDVVSRLNYLTKGAKCIIFSENNACIVEACVQLYRDLHKGERDIYIWNSKSYKVYKVGELPETFIPNPLFKNRLLRNGVCTETSFNWHKIEDKICYILLEAIETNELNIKTNADAKYIQELISNKEAALNRLKLRIPKAVRKILKCS